MDSLQRNLTQVLVTVAIAATSAVALAQEATQFADAPSQRSRAEVKAEIASPKIEEAGVVDLGEATEFIDAAGHADRAAVRQEARVATRNHALNLDRIGG